MKIAKWMIALIAITMVVGCEESTEEEFEDAAQEVGEAFEDLFSSEKE